MLPSTKGVTIDTPNTKKQLVTIKKASALTGSSPSFFRQLLREGKLTTHKINSATFVSLVEFEHIAKPVSHPVPSGR